MKQIQEQVSRLRKLGWVLVGLAAVVSALTYFLPNSETTYWLSRDGKQGFYVLSAFFLFLGFYCLGAIWRRRNFI